MHLAQPRLVTEPRPVVTPHRQQYRLGKSASQSASIATCSPAAWLEPSVASSEAV